MKAAFPKINSVWRTAEKPHHLHCVLLNDSDESGEVVTTTYFHQPGTTFSWLGSVDEFFENFQFVSMP